MKDWFGYASALSLVLASVAVGCSDEGDDPEQANLPVFGQGGSGAAAPVGAVGGTGGASPVGAGGTAPVAANGGTGGAPVAANGGTGGAPAANGGTGGAPGAGGTGVNAAGGTGAGGSAAAPPGAGGTSMGMGGAGMEPPPTGEAVSFQADVWPIFMAQCGGCHTTSGFGGHNVGSPTLATALADAQRLGEELVERLDGGGMPPGCSTAGAAPCISLDDLQTVEDWVDGGELP